MASKVCGDYKQSKLLGQGGFGEVYLVEKNKKKFALKTFKSDLFEGGVPESVVVELDILNRVNHPNVLGATETFIDSTGKICLVLELASSITPDLSKYMKIFPPNIIAPSVYLLKIMFEMLCGLHYLHTNFIMHRDIKPENILMFDSGTVAPTPKLADFGMSCIFYEPEPLNYQGEVVTPMYRAPELLVYDIKQNRQQPYGIGVDIWAMGLTCFQLITHENFADNRYALVRTDDLFGPLTDEQYNVVTRILSLSSIKNIHDLRLTTPNPIFKTMNKSYADFFLRMMQCDPAKRPSTGELLKDKLFVTNGLKCTVANIEYKPVKLTFSQGYTAKDRFEMLRCGIPKTLSPHIKFLAIDIFDRYLSSQNKYKMNINLLENVTYASIRMAMKAYYLDQGEPETGDVPEVEYDILRTLNFRIFRPTLDILFKGVNVKKLEECYLKSFVPDEVYVCSK